jgi:hypothetical protein
MYTDRKADRQGKWTDRQKGIQTDGQTVKDRLTEREREGERPTVKPTVQIC